MLSITISKDIIINKLPQEPYPGASDVALRTYTTHPLKGKAYVTDAIKTIYDKITYSDTDKVEAFANIDSYTNEPALVTYFLKAHKIITTAIINRHRSVLCNAWYDKMDDKNVIFKLE